MPSFTKPRWAKTTNPQSHRLFTPTQFLSLLFFCIVGSSEKVIAVQYIFSAAVRSKHGSDTGRRRQRYYGNAVSDSVSWKQNKTGRKSWLSYTSDAHRHHSSSHTSGHRVFHSRQRCFSARKEMKNRTKPGTPPGVTGDMDGGGGGEDVALSPRSSPSSPRHRKGLTASRRRVAFCHPGVPEYSCPRKRRKRGKASNPGLVAWGDIDRRRR